jgi:DNA-binding PadR family transcriptional regulator
MGKAGFPGTTLGVLVIRPWSAYDLTGYMRTSAVRGVWPRAESRLYAEPKNLVAHGLATSTREYTGRRSRTVYSITEAGRRALTDWLSRPSARREVEDEAMLRILLCDQGTREQLLATIRGAMEDLLGQIDMVAEIGDRLARGEAQHPGRLHVTALSSMSFMRMLRQRYDFLTAAEAWVREWDGTALDDEKAERAREVLDANRRELMGIRDGLHEALGTFTSSSTREVNC